MRNHVNGLIPWCDILWTNTFRNKFLEGFGAEDLSSKLQPPNRLHWVSESVHFADFTGPWGCCYNVVIALCCYKMKNWSRIRCTRLHHEAAVGVRATAQKGCVLCTLITHLLQDGKKKRRKRSHMMLMLARQKESERQVRFCGTVQPLVPFVQWHPVTLQTCPSCSS